MRLDGKTVVVTGAASGIGAGTAADLSRRGATVIGVDRNPIAGVDTTFQADLSDPASIDSLIAELPEGLHGLCNVAGVAPSDPGELVLKVNFLAVRHLALGLAPKLAPGGSIVNLASMAGNGWRDHLDQVGALLDSDWSSVSELVTRYDLLTGPRSYFLSKESVIVWTMIERWKWRDRGIRMNTVSPGPVETPILGDFLETLGPRAQESVHNLERFGRPSDVAPAIAFLLSDESRWFWASDLAPDGGMGAHLALKRHGLL